MTTVSEPIASEPIIFYFSSVSENTKKFVDKLGFESTRLPVRRGDAEVFATAPYVLVLPTYGGEVSGKGAEKIIKDAVPKQVIKFLNHEENRKLLRGVIAAGNRNFGEAYCIAGDIISIKCSVPTLYRFELMGTEADVNKVQEGLKQFWQQ